MSISRFEIVIPAVGSQPVVVNSTGHGVRQLILQGDPANANPFFVGDSAMATDGSEGIRVNFSATDPPFMEIGPFSGDAPIKANEIHIVGTEAQIVRAFLVTH